MTWQMSIFMCGLCMAMAIACAFWHFAIFALLFSFFGGGFFERAVARAFQPNPGGPNDK